MKNFETSKEKAERHANKEKKLREAFRGNFNARNELLKHIIRSHIVDKKALTEFIPDLQRLLAFPENYCNCEKNYNALFLLMETSDNEDLISMADGFKRKIN